MLFSNKDVAILLLILRVAALRMMTGLTVNHLLEREHRKEFWILKKLLFIVIFILYCLIHPGTGYVLHMLLIHVHLALMHLRLYFAPI